MVYGIVLWMTTKLMRIDRVVYIFHNLFQRVKMDTYVLDSDSLSCLEELKGFTSHYSVPSPAAENGRTTQHSAAPSSSSIAAGSQNLPIPFIQ